MRQLTFQRVLGSGAFGTVYLAELSGARGFRRNVAVKVLLDGQPDGEMFLSRVRDEARLLGLLHDEHILRVLELVRVQNRDAVVMEFVEGVDLGALVDPKAPPPPRALGELGAAVAGALHAAHTARHPATQEALNVIHRDVKPANLMITDRGSVKLLDFGVAQARFAARESRTGQFVLGTLNYMAPEYIITGDVSPAADIFGLALTLWEAAVGEPYGQPKLREELHLRRMDERMALLPLPFSELDPILRSMMRWDPKARPNGAAVEAELLAFADRVRGTGLRTWAASVVPSALERARKAARDTVGLAGQVVTIADGEGAPEEEAADYTLVRSERPAFLDAAPRDPVRAAAQPTLLPDQLGPPPAPPAPVSAPAAPASTLPASRPLAPPAPAGRSVTPSEARREPPASTPQPAPPTPADSGGRKVTRRRRSRAVEVMWVVVQALFAGGFVGLALVAAIVVYLVLNGGFR